MRDSYIERILTARVYDVAKETPLEPAPKLSKRMSNHVLLKREDQTISVPNRVFLEEVVKQ